MDNSYIKKNVINRLPSEELIESVLTEKDSLGNEVLYRMCREYPKHDNEDVIFSKIWLIGRSYAAAIERNKAEKKQEVIFDEVKKPSKWIDFDKRIRRLSGKKIFRNEDVFKEALSLHSDLTSFFYCITNLRKRSLASKYLHFHCPEAFYIFDSEVASIIRKFKLKPEKQEMNDTDVEYARYAMKVFTLANNIYDTYGIEMTPRQIDTLLQKLHHEGKPAS
jgi:hypothetical protein